MPLAAIPTSSAPSRRTELSVHGMTCASCVGRVEKALRAVPGVEEATVDLVTGRSTVVHDPDTTSPDTLVRAVHDAGYTAEPEPDAATEDRNRTDRLEARERTEERTLRRDLAIALPLTIPLLVLGMAHGGLPGVQGLAGAWLQLLLATPVVFGPGQRFLRLAWTALRHRSADMNTLVATGTLAAWTHSAAKVASRTIQVGGAHGGFAHVPDLYFEAAAAIVAFVLVGKFLETRTRKRLSEAVRGLVALVPATAHRERDGREEDVPVTALAPGDVALVRPGERIPTDGVVVRGHATIDESMLTGESLPAEKRAGASLFGGTLNRGGALSLRVTRTGRATALARIVDAVERAQATRAPIARMADVVSGWFVPAVLVVASVTFGVWLALDPTPHGLAIATERFVSVLVIACPCALGLATPAAVAVGTGRGAELGILTKGGATLEAVSRVDTILVDKTGTLTTGRPELTDVVAVAPHTEDDVLQLAASAERQSEHAVARAIVAGAAARGAARESARHFLMEPGAGVEAAVGPHLVRVGSRPWLARRRVGTAPLEPLANALATRGRTVSFVAIDGALAGLVAVADRPTDDASDTVAMLGSLGIDVAMVTGDRRGTAEAVAAAVGITRVVAEASPEDKALVVARERARGRTVAMVGDGVNDAPALAAADVGVAVGTGTDIAVATADIVLMRGGLSALPLAIQLARATLRTIRQNLFWAFVYNTLGIPVAAGLLYPVTGWLLSPVLASAAMSLSSVSVILNALRLRRFGRSERG